MVGFLIKEMREIDNFDEMCEFSFAIQGSKQFAAQTLRLLGFPSVGKVFPSAGEVFPIAGSAFLGVGSAFLGVGSAIPSVAA